MGEVIVTDSRIIPACPLFDSMSKGSGIQYGRMRGQVMDIKSRTLAIQFHNIMRGN